MAPGYTTGWSSYGSTPAQTTPSDSGYHTPTDDGKTQTTASDSGYSTPSDTFDDMDDTPEPREVKVKISDIDEATAVMTQIESGGADEFARTTHLELVIDSSDFGDWEDDVWCMFFRTFAPLSANLNHLTIIIRGNVLFTRNNYIKPQVFYSEEVVPARKEEDKGTPIKEESPESNDESANEPAAPLSKKQQKKLKKAAHGKATRSSGAAIKKEETTSAAKSPTSPKFKTVQRSPYAIELHIHEKLLVAQLLTLHKPIPRINIRGPMELSLRRYLISSLNTDWNSNPQLITEAGFGARDSARVAEVEAWEQSVPEMKCIEDGKGGEEFAAFKGGMGRWVVPTGKGGRMLMGYRTNSIGTMWWKGPGGR